MEKKKKEEKKMNNKKKSSNKRVSQADGHVQRREPLHVVYPLQYPFQR